MVWFFIILVFLTYILNSICLKYGMKGVNYIRKFSKQIVEIDEPFEMIMTVINKKLLPVPFLQIEEKIPIHLDYQSLYSSKENTKDITQRDFYDFTTTMYILPYQKVERRYVLSGNKRGRYIFRDTSLKVGDFIGLKDVYKTINGFQDLIVLPNRLELDEALESYGSYYGNIPIRRWIIDDPLMTIGIREYTGNEPEKYIHWPSSLKYGTLMVKNFDFTTDNKVNIVLNIESNKPFWENIRVDDIEACISLCRGVVEELERLKIPYSFTTNSHSISNKVDVFNLEKPSNLNEVLAALGEITYFVAFEFEEFIENMLNSKINFTTFIIITPKVFESYIEPIEKLKNRDNKVIIISVEKDNLSDINPSIIKYVMKKNNEMNNKLSLTN